MFLKTFVELNICFIEFTFVAFYFIKWRPDKE